MKVGGGMLHSLATWDSSRPWFLGSHSMNRDSEGGKKKSKEKGRRWETGLNKNIQHLCNKGSYQTECKREKMYWYHVQDKKLIARIYKESLKLNNERASNLTENGQTIWTDISLPKDEWPDISLQKMSKWSKGTLLNFAFHLLEFSRFLYLEGNSIPNSTSEERGLGRGSEVQPLPRVCGFFWVPHSRWGKAQNQMWKTLLLAALPGLTASRGTQIWPWTSVWPPHALGTLTFPLWILLTRSAGDSQWDSNPINSNNPTSID